PPVRQPGAITRPQPPPAAPPRRPPPDTDTPPPRSRKPEAVEDDGEAAPPRGRSKRADDHRREEPAASVWLVLGVGHDPDRELKGEYVGELTDTGLRLRQGDDKIRVKVGSRVKHRLRNQVEID